MRTSIIMLALLLNNAAQSQTCIIGVRMPGRLIIAADSRMSCWDDLKVEKTTVPRVRYDTICKFNRVGGKTFLFHGIADPAMVTMVSDICAHQLNFMETAKMVRDALPGVIRSILENKVKQNQKSLDNPINSFWYEGGVDLFGFEYGIPRIIKVTYEIEFKRGRWIISPVIDNSAATDVIPDNKPQVTGSGEIDQVEKNMLYEDPKIIGWGKWALGLIQKQHKYTTGTVAEPVDVIEIDQKDRVKILWQSAGSKCLHPR